MLRWIIKLLKYALKNVSLPEAKGCSCLVVCRSYESRLHILYVLVHRAVFPYYSTRNALKLASLSPCVIISSGYFMSCML